jgi:hypothetical protein
VLAYFAVIVHDPCDQCCDSLVEAVAKRGEGVFHAGRDLRVGGPGHQSVLLELADGDGEHPLGDAGDLALQVGLDYTIARITNPNDKPATRHIRSGFLGHDPVGSAMSRADIVAQLTDTRYLRARPAISN